jgi:hypothetical protein
MSFDNFIKILLAASSISIGAILGILRSKIFASKNANTLYYVFYGFAVLVFLAAVLSIFTFSKYIFVTPDKFGISVLVIAALSSVGLFIYSNKFLVFKNVYKASKLDPIVNKFTSDADKDEIKLFGGDLNFFGNDPSAIDKHPQYTHLKSIGFKKISILCETPITPTQIIRYGKILYEMPETELRFYRPEKADLKVRGRIIKVNGVNKLLMYTKVKSGVYQTLATDTANTSGALYNNIWELAWSMAIQPDPAQNQSYINAFRGGRNI